MGEQIKHRVRFLDSGREPRCAPDPRYPEGVDIDETRGAATLPSCQLALPYPAPRCGALLVECDRCGLRVLITVAGRVDDPRSIKLCCKLAPMSAAVH